jgi:metal-responsive CopG/Arc/MetJ family transcriptional regulator
MNKKNDEVHFLAPHDLVEEFDSTWKELMFSDRTAAFHELMRKFVKSAKIGKKEA